MAHPRRRAFVKELWGHIGPDDVIWDQKNSRWDTGRRSLLAYNPEATHHLVIQDDALCVPDIRDTAAEIARHVPDEPVSFYIGNTRPHAHRVTLAYQRAKRRGARWLVMEGPLWGPGLMIPTSHIESIVKFCDELALPNYDLRIATFYQALGRDCWYTMPSLVDHRSVDENPSLVHGRISDRKAHESPGTEGLGLDYDWGGTVAVGLMPRTREQKAYIADVGLEVLEPEYEGAWVTVEGGGSWTVAGTCLKGRNWVTDETMIERLLSPAGKPDWVNVEQVFPAQ